MFDLFKRYVDEGYMQLSDEGFRFGKERIIFYYTSFTAEELSINSRINGSRYLATKFISSRKEGEALIQQHGAQNTDELVYLLNSLIKIMNILGMGKFEVVKSDSKAGFAVLSGTSTIGIETKSEKLSDAPVDFMIGGLIAGAVGYYAKRRAYAVEVSCVAQKDTGKCIWVAGARANIINYIKESMPERADLASKTIDNIEMVEKEIDGREDLRGLV